MITLILISKLCVLGGDFVKNVKCGTSVAESLDSTRHQQILDNRHYIKALAKCHFILCTPRYIYCSDLDRNRGNYLEVLELIAEHDSNVADKLHNGPRNATYTSPNIQNSLLNPLRTGRFLKLRFCNN